MDIKAYIETGILETYALGLCNKQEAREVEEYCALYPEVKEELLKVQESLNTYASAYSKTPAASTKEQIFARIDELESSPTKQELKAEHTHFPDPKIIQLFERYRKATAIAASLLVVSLIGNIVIYNKYQSANKTILTLNSEKQVLADNLKASQTKLDGMSNDFAILSNPATQKVMMKGTQNSPESMAMIYWNKATHEVYLEVKNLPEPTPGKQYQLWAIVDGKPVDAGMLALSTDSSALHPMKAFENAQAFAITLEKEGGSEAPTLTAMYVMGAVSL